MTSDARGRSQVTKINQAGMNKNNEAQGRAGKDMGRAEVSKIHSQYLSRFELSKNSAQESERYQTWKTVKGLKKQGCFLKGAPHKILLNIWVLLQSCLISILHSCLLGVSIC